MIYRTQSKRSINASALALVTLLAVCSTTQARQQSAELLEAAELQQKAIHNQNVELIETTARLNDLRKRLAATDCDAQLVSDLEELLQLKASQQALLPNALKETDATETAAIHVKLAELYAASGNPGKGSEHANAASAYAQIPNPGLAAAMQAQVLADTGFGCRPK